MRKLFLIAACLASLAWMGCPAAETGCFLVGQCEEAGLSCRDGEELFCNKPDPSDPLSSGFCDCRGTGGSGGAGGGGGTGGSACGADTACAPGEAGNVTCASHCENDVCGSPTNTLVSACLDSGTCYCQCLTGECSDGTPACVDPIQCDPESTSDSCLTFFCNTDVCVGMIGNFPVTTISATCAGEPGTAYCECLCSNGRETCDPPQ